MSPAMIAVFAAIATGTVSLIGAILLGKLVPASRVTEKDAEVLAAKVEAEKWHLAYEEKSRAADALEAVVERQKIVTETVNQVLAALKQTTAQTPLPQIQAGGSP